MTSSGRYLVAVAAIAGFACDRARNDRPTVEDIAAELLGRTAADVRSASSEARDSTWDVGYGDGRSIALYVRVEGIGVLAPPCLPYEFVGSGTAVRTPDSVTGPVWELVFEDPGTASRLGVSVGSSLGELRANVDSIAVVAIEGQGWYAHVDAADGAYRFLLDRFDADVLKREELWVDSVLRDPSLVPDSALITEIRYSDGRNCSELWNAASTEWQRRRR